MKIWNIVTPKDEYTIEVDNSTTLYGHKLTWHSLTRHVDEYFNGRNSQVEIFEDGLPINKKDWKCIFIPFDAEMHLSKITAKSPLKDIQNKVSDQLTYSPFYQELFEVWEQLDGELDFINQKLGHWGISANLKPFDEHQLKDFIMFNSTKGKELSPLEIKTLLINIIMEKPYDKKTLIIVELPELFADNEDMNVFYQMIEKATSNGYKFLFISQQKNLGIKNYIYKKTIINHALLEQMKIKVQNEVPFYCSDVLYEQAKSIFLQIVDNSIREEDILQNVAENLGAIVTIIHVIMYNLNVGSLQVPQELEPNLRKFISDYR